MGQNLDGENLAPRHWVNWSLALVDRAVTGDAYWVSRPPTSPQACACLPTDPRVPRRPPSSVESDLKVNGDGADVQRRPDQPIRPGGRRPAPCPDNLRAGPRRRSWAQRTRPAPSSPTGSPEPADNESGDLGRHRLPTEFTAGR